MNKALDLSEEGYGAQNIGANLEEATPLGVNGLIYVGNLALRLFNRRLSYGVCPAGRRLLYSV